MTYKEPPMKFNPGLEKYEVVMPLKKDSKVKSVSTDLTKKGIIIFLAGLIGTIIIVYFLIKFFV
jgi:hypothetical protein